MFPIFMWFTSYYKHLKDHSSEGELNKIQSDCQQLGGTSGATEQHKYAHAGAWVCGVKKILTFLICMQCCPILSACEFFLCCMLWLCGGDGEDHKHSSCVGASSHSSHRQHTKPTVSSLCRHKAESQSSCHAGSPMYQEPEHAVLLGQITLAADELWLSQLYSLFLMGKATQIENITTLQQRVCLCGHESN